MKGKGCSQATGDNEDVYHPHYPSMGRPVCRANRSGLPAAGSAARSCSAVGRLRVGKVAAPTSGSSRMNPGLEGRVHPLLGEGVPGIIDE